MEQQRVEAYRNYMSDSFALLNTALTRGEIDIPRYADMFGDHAEKPQETAEQVISHFDSLRRPS